MGYRCPVCETPQSDARHLANHLGFTALIRDGDHEVWLDEHVSDWDQLDDQALADQVAPLAESVDFPPDDGPGGGFQETPRNRTTQGATPSRQPNQPDRSTDEQLADEEIQEVLQRARELAAKRREKRS